MSWNGSMTCQVTNQTTDKIFGVFVRHQWTEDNSSSVPPTNPTAVLEPDGKISFTINVGSGGSDLWSLAFINTSGQCYYRENKQCNVEEEDLGNVPVYINLEPNNFSIVMPKSSSCNENDYNTAGL